MYELGPEFENRTVGPGTSLLISGPPLTGKRRLAFETLAQGAESGEGSVIITTRDSVDRVLPAFQSLLENPDEAPVGIVDCVTHHQGRSREHTELVKYASSPMDMTGIGITFSELVDAFSDDHGVAQTRIAMDSLSTLLHYSDTQTVFRFMHVLTGRIQDAGAMGVFVIDSAAHDAETTNTLRQLFDDVVAVDDQAVTGQLEGDP